MLELSDLAVSLIIGLAAPLAILDSSRLMFEGLIPERGMRHSGQGRLLAWILAIVMGPALYAERVIAEVKSGDLKGERMALAVAAVFAWCWLYGLALIGLLRQIHG